MKNNGYFECVLTNGTREDFDKLCNAIDEFGANKDMIIFVSKNRDNDKKITLQIIPKNQILQIINHYLQDDMNRVWEVKESD